MNVTAQSLGLLLTLGRGPTRRVPDWLNAVAGGSFPLMTS